MTKTLAIIGANDTVGRDVLAIIEEKGMTFSKLHAIAPNVQFGQEVSYGEEGVLPLEDLKSFDFSNVDIVLNAAGSQIAKDIVKRVQDAGAVMVDISGAFRMDSDVPLIVSGVNDDKIFEHKGIVSGTNCVVTAIAAALKPLHDKAGLNRIHAVTYQSVSGVGKLAMDELFNQTRSVYMADVIKGTEFPKQIAFNVLPAIGNFMDDRTTQEEFSVKAETKKILGTKIGVTATCVRVPVFIGHAAALHVDFDDEISAIEARDLLRQTRGITVIDVENEDLEYMTPLEVQGEDDVYVSRIREDSASDNGLALWVVADNIHRGLALNALQIVEKLAQA